ncbi:MAG: hypothetical protein HZB18_06470 [Chloroflexi bacterium]|nr:hypothetical protein [Chloroflexota bacterium]
MQNSEWLEKYFEKVAQSSAEGRDAVEYVRARNIKVGMRRARKSVGAFWTLGGKFFLNSVHHSQQSVLENPRAWTLFVHEVRHLQQGALTALSIYGELDAWQVEFNLYKKLTGKPLHAVLEELLSLPLNMDRDNLRHARKLMMQYAGKGYGANFLPLYPIHREIKYWGMRR